MPLRARFILALLAAAGLGLAAKAFAPTAAHAAGLFYVAFWVFLVLAVRPGLSAWKAALAVLLITCMLETLQLWPPPLLERLRRPWLGQTLLGAVFSWMDFPFYVAGAAGAWAFAALLGARR